MSSIVYTIDALHEQATPAPWELPDKLWGTLGSDKFVEFQLRTPYGPGRMGVNATVIGVSWTWDKDGTNISSVRVDDTDADLIVALRNHWPAIARVLRAAEVATNPPSAMVNSQGEWVINHEAFADLTDAIKEL